MTKPRFDVERELDEVVGEYEASPGEHFWRRFGRVIAKALAGASLAIAAMVLVMYVLHSHIRQAQVAPAPKKPVMIDITPAPR